MLTRRALALTLLISGVSTPVFGQTETSPVPRASGPADLSEVEDVVDDGEVLPKNESTPKSARGRANIAAIEEMQAEELSYSNMEMRARYDYGVSLGVGPSRPWQSSTIDAFAILRPNLAFLMYAGTGHVSQPGMALSQTYDMDINARAFGIGGRYFFDRVDGFSIEALLGYAAWEGKLSPEGSDDEISSNSEKLSASFHATGVTGGVGVVVDWILDSGIFIDWTIVGTRISRVTALDLSRDSEATTHAVRRDLQRAAFYGLTNIRVGYLF